MLLFMFFSASSALIAKPFLTLSSRIRLVKTLLFYNSSEKLGMRSSELETIYAMVASVLLILSIWRYSQALYCSSSSQWSLYCVMSVVTLPSSGEWFFTIFMNVVMSIALVELDTYVKCTSSNSYWSSNGLPSYSAIRLPNSESTYAPIFTIVSCSDFTLITSYSFRAAYLCS